MAAGLTTIELRPGATLVTPDGWRGTWDVRETVRTVFLIWKLAQAWPQRRTAPEFIAVARDGTVQPLARSKTCTWPRPR